MSTTQGEAPQTSSPHLGLTLHQVLDAGPEPSARPDRHLQRLRNLTTHY
ncbi:hypothetical protein [Streptomyces sp. NPDC058955]